MSSRTARGDDFSGHLACYRRSTVMTTATLIVFGYFFVAYVIGLFVFRKNCPDDDLYLFVSPISVPVFGYLVVKDWWVRRRSC